MAIIVEHDKRKHEILQKSLDVFIDEGYEDATFQKIADRCGITRTTLYIYFSNKHEIFLGSIKELLKNLETTLSQIVNNESLTAEAALRSFFDCLIDQCQENVKLFSVLLSYLIQIKKTGKDPNDRVRRRVIRVRHHMTTIIIRGIQDGEFKDLPIKDVNEMFYGLIEAAIFRLAVLNAADISDIKKSIDIAVDGILSH
ncbi:MAG: TetR/AcrR family transcriptional regulator [Treponema sp.]|nr:TetR/AcrR family transcriptional regulator [Spirochaetia bacterium]MDD7269741.1 TetR/AcrR family transcriptional regulator [Treponema sp.]MDY4984393.1 TetR/AcrR family transcriptional regulator [Treponema sp.]MDY5817275.1 TetR/AcrR family transcriptional regulator [Treponema sp.]